jgi:hypothetical protein
MERRWTNPSQPQTLQIAVWLLYFNGVLGLVFGTVFGRLGPLLAIAALVGCVAAAFGIANEARWGYTLGVVAAGGLTGLLGPLLISFAFAVALLALLVHPMSREYQRIWFH